MTLSCLTEDPDGTHAFTTCRGQRLRGETLRNWTMPGWVFYGKISIWNLESTIWVVTNGSNNHWLQFLNAIFGMQFACNFSKFPGLILWLLRIWFAPDLQHEAPDLQDKIRNDLLASKMPLGLGLPELPALVLVLLWRNSSEFAQNRCNMYQKNVANMVHGSLQPQLPTRDVDALSVPNSWLQGCCIWAIGTLSLHIVGHQLCRTNPKNPWFQETESLRAKSNGRKNSHNKNRAGCTIGILANVSGRVVPGSSSVTNWKDQKKTHAFLRRQEFHGRLFQWISAIFTSNSIHILAYLREETWYQYISYGHGCQYPRNDPYIWDVPPKLIAHHSPL